MRRKAQNGPLSVHAIAGSYVTLLGIDMEEASAQGVLGFAIERMKLREGRLPDPRTLRGVTIYTMLGLGIGLWLGFNF